jgi:hypothetical protein
MLSSSITPVSLIPSSALRFGRGKLNLIPPSGQTKPSTSDVRDVSALMKSEVERAVKEYSAETGTPWEGKVKVKVKIKGSRILVDFRTPELPRSKRPGLTGFDVKLMDVLSSGFIMGALDGKDRVQIGFRKPGRLGWLRSRTWVSLKDAKYAQVKA